MFSSDASDTSDGYSSSEEETEHFNYRQEAEKQVAAKGDLNKLWEGLSITELGLFRQIHQALKNIPQMLAKTERDGAGALKEHLSKLNILTENLELHQSHMETSMKDKTDVYFFIVVVYRALKAILNKLSVSGETKGAVGLLKISFNASQMKALLGKSSCAEVVHGFNMLKSNTKFYNATAAQLHAWKSASTFAQNGQKNQSSSKKSGNGKGGKKESNKPMFPNKKLKKDED